MVHLPLVLDARGVPASVRGGAFAVYALVALVLMAGPAPYLANRLGRFPPLAGGLVLIGTALLWLSFGGSTGAVYGAMALFGLGFGLLFPAATALVADATVPAERASAFGVFYAAYSLGVVAGRSAAGCWRRRSGPPRGLRSWPPPCWPSPWRPWCCWPAGANEAIRWPPRPSRRRPQPSAGAQ